MKVLLGIFREVMEEKGQKGIDVLASGDSVAHAAVAVRVAHVDGLIEEDNGSIVIPRVRVVDNL